MTHTSNTRAWQCLSGNALKLIAALTMLIDHVGVILLPDVLPLRVIGRIAFPIFAFMIAEGSRYTKSRVRYFCSVLFLGVLCQIGLWVYNPDAKLNVLLTFSVSILLLYALQHVKNVLVQDLPTLKKLLFSLPFPALFAVALLFCHLKSVEYGFAGCILPLFPAVLYPAEGKKPAFLTPFPLVLLASIGVLVLAVGMGGVQWFALLSLPLLLVYSGKRGKYRMKYFFYLFYPLHILLLEGLALLLALR